MNRKAAIRRPVEHIERTGDWGEVVYRHHLGCGHVEVRPRATKAPAITCTTCIRIDELNQLAATTTTLGARLRPEPVRHEPVEVHQEMFDAQRLRATLAATFQVPAEQVTLHPGSGGWTATVFLDVDTLAQLA